jgi:hypothetical protein
MPYGSAKVQPIIKGSIPLPGLIKERIMPEFQVRLFVRTTGHSAYTETSWHIELPADTLEAAEAEFIARHLRDGRYRFVHRKTLILIERAHVLRIEIEEVRV